MTATSADLEQHVAELDSRRRALAAELFNRNRSAGGTQQQDAAGAHHLRELSRAAAALDQERQEAHAKLRRSRESETARKGWEAALPVLGDHRQVCGEVARCAVALADALSAEQALHAMLRREAGVSVLPGLIYSDDKLVDRLRRRRCGSDHR